MEVLAELVARITADATGLKKALTDSERAIQGTGKAVDKETKSISEQFKEIGKTATIMGAAVTASMTAMILSFDRTGSELHDLALKTGVSVEALAGLKYAAEQNGASLGTVEMAIKRTAAAMQGVQDGTAESTRAFDRMGISLTDLQGLNPEQQFLKIAGAIANIPDPMTRAATAQDLFGRSGMDMLPMLSQGANGLKKMMEQGVKYNKWSTESANLADALGDSFTDLKTAMSGATNTIAAVLAPAITSLSGIFTGLTSKVSDFLKEQPELTKALGGAALAMGILATAIGTVSIAMTFLAAHPVAAALMGITVIVGGLIAAGIALYETFKKIEPVIPIDPIKALGDALEITRKEATKLASEAESASSKAIKAFDKLGDATVDALKRRNKEMEQEEQDSLNTRLQAAKDFWDDIEREMQSTQKSNIRAIEDMRDAEIDASRDAIDARRKWYNDTVKIYEADRDKRLETLRDSSSKEVKAIQSQIDKIEEQRDEQRKGEQSTQDAIRKSSLISQWQVANAKGDKAEMARINENLASLESDIRKRQFEEARQAEIKALRDKIDLIREDEKTKEKQFQKDLDNQKSALKTELETFVTNQEDFLKERKGYWAKRIEGENEVNRIANEITAEQRRLTLVGYATDLTDLKTKWKLLNDETVIQGDAMNLIVKTDQTELINLLTTYNPKWQDAGVSFGTALVKGLESTRASMEATVASFMGLLGGAKVAQVTAASAAAGAALDVAAFAEAKGIQPSPGEESAALTAQYQAGTYPGTHEEYLADFAKLFEVPNYQTGGTVPGTIGEPQLAMVHGGETITPAGKSGVTIVFEGPVYGFADFESKIAQAVKGHAIRGGFHGVF